MSVYTFRKQIEGELVKGLATLNRRQSNKLGVWAQTDIMYQMAVVEGMTEIARAVGINIYLDTDSTGKFIFRDSVSGEELTYAGYFH